MLIETVNIFPIPIGKFDDLFFEDECDRIISALNNAKKEKYGAMEGNAETTFNLSHSINQFLPEDLQNILNLKLNVAIDQYSYVYGVMPQEITNTWVSYQYRGSKLNTHTHPGSHISGVLYLRADEKSSPIYFKNPNPYLNFTPLKPDISGQFKKGYKFTPKTGMALLFPSWLGHGSGGEISESEERIIISFNTGLGNNWNSYN